MLLLTTLLACNDAATQAVKKIDPIAFSAALEEKEEVQLVDVRSKEEFGSGHIENAVNYDVNADDFREQLGSLDKNKPLFLYCAAGTRSGKASEIAAEAGFKEIYDLSGGIRAWQAGQLPVKE